MSSSGTTKTHFRKLNSSSSLHTDKILFFYFIWLSLPSPVPGSVFIPMFLKCAAKRKWMSVQLSDCQLPPRVPHTHPVLLKVVFIHALFHQYFDFKCHRSNFRLERQVRFAPRLLSRIWSKVQRSGRPGHTVCTYFVCAHAFVWDDRTFSPLWVTSDRSNAFSPGLLFSELVLKG